MKKFSVKLVFFYLAGASATFAYAEKFVMNDGGLGCGAIISMRESTQQPISSELRDAYGSQKTSGGGLGQVLYAIPGVGIIGAAVGQVVGAALVNSVSSNSQDSGQKKADVVDFKNVMAIEFRFDDGSTVNVPALVIQGMRYNVGTRLNAMVSPRYGSFALGAHPLFGAAPDVGDSNYNKMCRIDDPEARKTILESVKNMVDESRIVKPSERRMISTPAVAIVVGVAAGN